MTGLDISVIICLTREPEGERTSPDPALYYAKSNSRLLFQSQDGYFLFFRFKIATISNPIVSIICNSSYVLIMITSPERFSVRVRARPPASQVSILYCNGAAVSRFEIEKQVTFEMRAQDCVECIFKSC